MFSFCIKLFLTPASASVWGPALGAPLSPHCHCWPLPLCHLGWDCDADTEGYLFPGAKCCLLPAKCFILMGSSRKKWRGNTCPSKQGHPEACSGLLVLGGNIWGAGNTSPPCQQPQNSHLRHYQAIHSQARRLK